MESLGEDVHAVLPELSQESVEQVVDFLNDVADCPEDLKDLKEDDFESLLVARSARRLLNYLTKKYGEQPLDESLRGELESRGGNLETKQATGLPDRSKELLGFDHEHPNVLHPESCSESTSYSDKHTDICPNDAHTDAKAKQLTSYTQLQRVYFYVKGEPKDDIYLSTKFNNSPAFHTLMVNLHSEGHKSGKADKTAWFYQEIILPRNIEQLTYHLRVNGKQKMKDKSVNGLQVSGDVFQFDGLSSEQSSMFLWNMLRWTRGNEKTLSEMLDIIHLEPNILSTGTRYLQKLRSFRYWAECYIPLAPETLKKQMKEKMDMLVMNHIENLTGMKAGKSCIQQRVTLALVLICLHDEGFIQDPIEDWKDVVFNALEVEPSLIDDTNLINILQKHEKCDGKLQRFIENFLVEEHSDNLWVKCIPLLYLLRNGTPICENIEGDLRDDQHGTLLCSLEITNDIGSRASERFIRSLTLSQMKCINEEVPIQLFLEKAYFEISMGVVTGNEISQLMEYLFNEVKSRNSFENRAKTSLQIDDYHTACCRCEDIMKLLQRYSPPMHWGKLSARIYTVGAFNVLANQSGSRTDISKYVSDYIVPFLKPESGVVQTAQQMLKVYAVLHQSKGWDKDFKAAFIESAMFAVKDILKNQSDRLLFHQSPEVFETLLSNVFHAEWTDVIQNDSTYQRFFTWDLMDAFLELFNHERYPLYQNRLTQEKRALETYIKDIMHKLIRANITQKQCLAISENNVKFISLVKNHLNLTSRRAAEEGLEDVIELRTKQLCALTQVRKELVYLIYMCNQMGCKGVSENIKTWLDQTKNNTLSEIYDLPSYHEQLNEADWMESNPFTYIPAETNVALKRLYRLKDTYFSNHFKYFFRHLKDVQSMDLVTLTAEVLNPVLQSWDQLCKDMENGSIRLRTVYMLFHFPKKTPTAESIRIAVSDMCNGIIPERCEQIERFFKLINHKEATEAICKFRETYKKAFPLPFKVIERRVQTDLPLSSMTEDVVEITKELDDMDNAKLEMLKTFIRAKDLVLWLQTELKSSQEVRALVRSFTSSPQNAVDITNASNLEAVATICAPLIYDIPADAGLEVFQQRFNLTWNLSTKEKDFLLKLADLMHKVEWLKDLKSSQSGEGVDALKLVEMINSTGKYVVGIPDDNLEIGQNLDRIIYATVPDPVKNAEHESKEKGEPQAEEPREKHFTYSKLKELQSKLMLISGENEGSSQEIKSFVEVLDGVTGVAEIFCKIVSSGNTLFQKWQSIFLCDRDADVNTYINFGLSDEILSGSKEDCTVVEHIRQVWDFMDKCLTGWKRHLSGKRKTCPVLNHFTTAQIVLLRKGLSKISSEDPAAIPAEVYPLLYSVHPDCTLKDVKEAWRATIQLSTEEERSASTGDLRMIEDDLLRAEDERVAKNLIREGFHRELILKAIEETDSRDEKELMLWCWSKQDDDIRKGAIDSTAIQREETHDIITMRLLQRHLRKPGSLHSTLLNLWHEYLGATKRSVKDLLSIEHLGTMLTWLKNQNKEQETVRQFPEYLKVGRPNLLVCPKADVWKTVLSIYMRDSECPLPSREEIILCTPDTSYEEVELLLLRAVHNTNKVYMLVHADSLTYEVAKRVEAEIHKTTQGCPDYRLVILCSAEMKDKCLLVPALYAYLIEKTVDFEVDAIKQYVYDKLRYRSAHRCAKADPESLTVRIVQSKRAGVGKGLCIKNMANKLVDAETNNLQDEEGSKKSKELPIHLPLHNKLIDKTSVVNRLYKFLSDPNCQRGRIFHIDIDHEMNRGVDDLLFDLVILGSIVDPNGYIWLRSERDFYAIEVRPLQRWEIDPSATSTDGKQNVHHMLELLPTITCHGPEDSLVIMKALEVQDEALVYSKNDQLMDVEQFKSEPFQRVYKYLKIIDSNEEGPIEVDVATVEGDMVQCLEKLIQNCGLQDPSWSELNHFIQFLNIQWECYEDNIFCHLETIKDNVAGRDTLDNLPDLPEFVVKAMLQMSKDFATRSLVIAEKITSPYTQDQSEQVVADYQFKRKWESCAHPYVFFNSDTVSMTFMGFFVGLSGDDKTINLMDSNGECVQKDIMSVGLYNGLSDNGVDMRSVFDEQKRGDQLKKLGCVMGVGNPDKDYVDPDEGYVLTSDNVTKMMAIYMRFRCNIPVVIMGESGCGKTYLVNFMCQLMKPPDADVVNILTLKVHGGTTSEQLVEKVREAEAQAKKNHHILAYRRPQKQKPHQLAADEQAQADDHQKVHGGTKMEDVVAKVKEAESQAKENHKQYPDMYTVLFLDEVNTTEALGLVKEVLCDGTLNGEPLDMDSGLRLVAACNPYKKHSKEMIKSLEEAGLGYRVRSDETLERFGCVPMRNLVYRVEPLPHSLIPLVWDFGELDESVETLYTRKIVERHLGKKAFKHDFQSKDIETIVDILHASQSFMRERKDECSLVSLRDLDRAMVVLEWFIKNENHLRREDALSLDDLMHSCTKKELNTKTWAMIMTIGVCYQASLVKNRADYQTTVARHFKGDFQLTEPNDTISYEMSRCQDKVIRAIRLEPTIARNEALKENIFMMVVCMELRIPLFIIGKPGSSKSLARQVLADAMEGPSSYSDLFKEFKKVHMASYQCSPHSTSEGIVAVFDNCALIQKDQNTNKFVATVVLDEVGLAEDSPKLPLKTLHHLLEGGSCNDKEDPQDHKKVGFVGISNWALDPAKNNRGLMVQRAPPNADDLRETAMSLCSTDEKASQRLQSCLGDIAKGYFKLYIGITTGDKYREFFGLRDFYSLVKMLFRIAKEKEREPSEQEIKHAILRNFGGLLDFNPLPFFFGTDDQIKDDDRQNRPTALIKANLEMKDNDVENRHLLLLTEDQMTLSTLEEHFDAIKDAVVIYGSSFPKDINFTKICRTINRIKLCMETGKTVVLVNLSQVYESLYDALNQYYTKIGNDRLVDIGLGTQRVKCKVHKQFKLVVVAEYTLAYETFPIPLLNRFEKHFIATSTVLTKRQARITNNLNVWAKIFVQRERSTVSLPRQKKAGELSPADTFIGFREDTPAVIVLQVTRELEADMDDPAWDDEVMALCKRRLLQCATPEAVVHVSQTELKDEAEEIRQIYMEEQQHESLLEYLDVRLKDNEVQQNAFIQVTTHSQLLSAEQCLSLTEQLSVNVEGLLLTAFGTEQEFSDTIRVFFNNTLDKPSVLLIQYAAGNEQQDLISCCRYIIIDEYMKWIKQTKEIKSARHVVLAIHLPQRAGGCFSGFQLGHWECVHIDTLYQNRKLPPMQHMLHRPVSAFIRPIGVDTVDEEEVNCVDLEVLFTSSIIQALSKLRDEGKSTATTERIRKRLGLCATDTKEGTSFLEVLQKRVYLLQCEREEEFQGQGWDWLTDLVKKTINTKMQMLSGQVWEYFQKKVTGLIAAIIGYADSNNNLDILLDQDTPEWKRTMWLDMLDDPECTPLSIKDDIGPGDPEEILVRMFGAYGSHMTGCLPFSWVIRHTIDNIPKPSVYTNGFSDGMDRGNEFTEHRDEAISIGTLLKVSKIWNIIDDAFAEADNEDDVMMSYLQDYVAMVYKPQTKHVERECQLIQQAVMIVYESFALEELTGREHVMPLIHAAYESIEGRIHIFSQIVQRFPDVVNEIKHFREHNPEHPLCSKKEMALDVLALKLQILNLQPNRRLLRNTQDCQRWYQETGEMAPLIRVAFARIEDVQGKPGYKGYGQICKEETETMRNDWDRMLAVRTFASVVCPPGSEREHDITLHCPLLWMDFENADMSSREIIEKIDATLGTIITRVSKTSIEKCGACSKEMVEVKVLPCAHEACIPCLRNTSKCLKCKEDIDIKQEMVSQISRGQERLNTVKEKCQYFYFEIVERMCLRSSSMKTDLKNFLVDKFIADAPMDKTAEGLRDNNIPLVMKAVDLHILMTSDPIQLQHDIDKVLRKDTASPTQSDFRLALIYVQCMEDQIHNKAAQLTKDDEVWQFAAGQLNECQEGLSQPCLDGSKLDSIAKARYGLRIAAEWLHKMASGSCEPEEHLETLFVATKNVCSLKHTPWPRNFLTKTLVRRFSISTVVKLSKGSDFGWLMGPEKGTQEEMNDLDPLSLLGEDYKGTYEGFLNDQFMESSATGIEELFADISTFNKHMEGKDKSIVDLVVHFVATVLTHPNQTLLHIFKQLMTSPGDMTRSYLPAMPQDQLAEHLQALRKASPNKFGETRFYQCPQGHVYAIGECGKPVMRSRCLEPGCNSIIGGAGHYILAPGNEEVKQLDRTKTGYVLGEKDKKSFGVPPERNMTSIQTTIVRLFVNLSLLYAADSNAEAVCTLIEPAVEAGRVSEFLWDHIVNDLGTISEGMSQDDTMLLIHRIIIGLGTEQVTSSVDSERVGATLMTDDKLLESQKARQEWEDAFVKCFIARLLDNKAAVLKEAYRSVVKHGARGLKELLDMVHEVDDDYSPGMELDQVNFPHLWRYRTRVTLDHLTRTFTEQQKQTTGDKEDTVNYPVLSYFLENEQLLRAVKLLPKVLTFQRQLLQKYGRKITRKEAEEKTMPKACRGPHVFVRKAVDIVKQHCKTLGLSEDEKCDLVKMCNPRTQLIYLLPTSSGKGRGAFLLVALLVKVHNHLMDILARKAIDCTLGPEITLADLTQAHLVNYDPDRDLLRIVMTNCTSSLEAGKGTDIRYDFESMEYQLKERLIAGASPIHYQGTEVVFLDNLTAINKLKTLDSIIKQEPLSIKMQAELRPDARFMVDVCDLLGNLDVAIGFLHSVGGGPERLLVDFMSTDLRLKAALPMRVKQNCRLKHIKALWLFMSNQRSKLSVKPGAHPFSHVEDEYLKETLTEEQELALYDKLPSLNLELLLLELYECITFYIACETDDPINIQAPLTSYLDVMDTVIVAGQGLCLPHGVKEIAVGQSIDTWRAVNEYCAE